MDSGVNLYYILENAEERNAGIKEEQANYARLAQFKVIINIIQFTCIFKICL